MSSRVFAFSVKLPESSVPQTSANIAPVDVAENKVGKRYVLLTRDPIVHFLIGISYLIIFLRTTHSSSELNWDTLMCM